MKDNRPDLFGYVITVLGVMFAFLTCAWIVCRLWGA